jgi:hypothetical protein
VPLASPFVATYHLEIDPDLPSGKGETQVFFPGGQTAGSSDMLVKVIPAEGRSWFANFLGGDYPLTCLTTHPDPDVFCAVVRGAGYLVRASAPQDCVEVRAIPVLQVLPDISHRLLFFASFTGIAAYGWSGMAWRKDFVMDGLQILGLNESEMRIRGDHHAGPEEQLVVDGTTGALLELPCGHRRWEAFVDPYPGQECLVCGRRRIQP